MPQDTLPPTPESAAAADDDAPGGFTVVGIGASAGGLEALTHLLSQLPANTGMGFVVVQHLDPTHESQLTAILSKATSLPVTEVQGSPLIEPDHVYVIPPNTTMVSEKGRLVLSPRGDAAGPHLPIDLFLRSLAADRQERAIGVILSGTGFDGTVGLGQIKEAGGITFAQDEKTAKYPGMPQHAAQSGCVDFVLPPDAIAQKLSQIGTDPRPIAPAAEPEPAEDAAPVASGQDESFDQILAILRTATGINFSGYRDQTLRRRIGRRMLLARQDTMAGYARYLEEHASEVQDLYRDILINVTSFFRDPDVFEALRTQVFPLLVKSRSLENPIRIWTPGCATGQETYSLAMALLEFLDTSPTRPGIQLFGTDICDPAAIERARIGHYPQGIESEVSPERLRRFFVKDAGGYRIGKMVRELCVFARQNLAADPPFSRMDLISCRNVLIYLGAPLQQRIMPVLHYALNPNGFLLLGTSESVGRYGELFSAVDKKCRIFSRNSSVVRPVPALAERTPPPRLDGLAPAPAPARAPNLADLQREADRIDLSRYAPAGVLVNDELEVVQFRGRTRAYLEPPPGEATFNLLRLARESLFVPLRGAVEDAKTRQTPVLVKGVAVRDDQRSWKIDLEVVPLRLPGSSRGGFLIHFHEPPATGETRPAAVPAAAPGELERLREELVVARQYLQSIIEQQAAANEELQSANEEILSANEELQSTNEELQTAKEEAQSINEELTTVNDELQSRNAELGQANDDLTNLLSSVNIPIIILGTDLRIRRFTPAASRALGLSDADLGRPLNRVRLPLDIPDLSDLALNVTESLASLEREVRDEQGRWRILRVMPYRTADKRIDGATIVLLDIDDLRRAQDALSAANLAKDRFLATLSHELRTPLTPAIAALALIDRDPRLPADLHEDIKLIKRNIALEAYLINDLLDVSRIINGKLELRIEDIDAAEVLREAAGIVSADLEAKRQTLVVTTSGAPYWVRGDRARLYQVFWNLLRNASKFSPAQGRIEVTAVADRKTARFEVKDSGIGIEPSVLPRLFRPFEQADPGTGIGGMGLGLTICKGIVELLGGHIRAFSAGKGQGATFTVELPVTIPASPTPVKGAAGESAPPAPKALRILLVDDDVDTSKILSRLLTSDGCAIEVAGDVATALAKAGSGKFDLVISDLGLPDGSGVELLTQLRQRGDMTPAIALSGFGQDQDLRRTRAAGFAVHLIKPVFYESLIEAIAKACGGGLGLPKP